MENKISILKNWKLHVTILVCCMASDAIGFIRIPLTDVITVTLLPLLYAMVFVTIIYLIKPITWVKKKQVPTAQFMMNLTCVILGAKLGVNVAQSFDAIANAGSALLVQNVGDAFTAVIALPIALFLGMKREAIGLCHANSREANIGIISNKYGPDSKEFQGVIGMYIVGTMFGTITVGLLSSVLTTTGIFHPYSAAMASGVGSAAMSTAGLGTLIGLYPEMATEITAYVTVSNLISSAIAVYLAIFLGLPITEFFYKIFEPKIGRKTKQEVN